VGGGPPPENIVPELCGDRMRVGVKKATGAAEETGGADICVRPRLSIGGSEGEKMERPKSIRFLEAPREEAGATSRWDVISVGSKIKIGEVRWWARGRQYPFSPLAETLYEEDCLRNLADLARGDRDPTDLLVSLASHQHLPE